MAKKYERKDLVKKNWNSTFELIGKVKITDNTFSLENRSEKSDWLWNKMNLYVDCGEKHGSVFCQLMGGYGTTRNNLIYVHGKKDDGTDDFENHYTIDFEDRFNSTITSDLGASCFKRAFIEKDVKNNLVKKEFLADYDMIQYLSETLENDMVVHIRGTLSYRVYNGKINVEKDVSSIRLYDAEPENFKATFRQTVLVDRDSLGEINKEKKTACVSAYILEKFKEYNGHDLTNNGETNGKFVPLLKEFEFDLSQMKDAEQAKKALNKLFKPKKGVSQITFNGYFVEGGATVAITEDDVTDDVKELIELGIMTWEDVEASCAGSGSREYRMVFKSPHIKSVQNADGTTTNTLQLFEGEYQDEDLQLECLTPIEDEEDDDDTETTTNTTNTDDDDDDASWLDEL